MMKRALQFNRPTIINDTKEVQMEAERIFKEIVRDAVGYFGCEKVKSIVGELTKSRSGNKADETRNSIMLAEYDAEAAKGKVNHKKFAEGFCWRHRQQSVEAVEKHLRRLLNTRQEALQKEAVRAQKFRKLVSKRGKTLLGTE